MSSTKRKIRLTCAFAALAALALAVSCRGFFVKPTLSSINVAPSTSTIDAGTTNNVVQMSAIANYDDGSTGKASVSWGIAAVASGPNAATITASGLVTSAATAVGAMTVTATSLQNGTLTATATVNVQPPNLKTIMITPSSTQSLGVGLTLPFTATGVDAASNQYDITAIATWNSSNTSIATIASGGVLTANTTTAGSTVVSANLEGVTSNLVTVNVHQ